MGKNTSRNQRKIQGVKLPPEKSTLWMNNFAKISLKEREKPIAETKNQHGGKYARNADSGATTYEAEADAENGLPTSSDATDGEINMGGKEAHQEQTIQEKKRITNRTPTQTQE